MKIIKPIATTLVVLACLYIFSYRASHLSPVSPGETRNYKLVILGIPVPYNSFTKKMYSGFYCPLISLSDSDKPMKNVSGKILMIDKPKASLLVSRAEQVGIAIHIPATMESELQPFKKGDLIEARYSTRRNPDEPFNFRNELASISPIQN
jgi:hypothetical protein